MKNTIRIILIKEWDPLLIGDNEFLWDEYDEYADLIYKYIIQDGIKYDVLYSMLTKFESDIGMETSKNTKKNVVNLILGIRDK